MLGYKNYYFYENKLSETCWKQFYMITCITKNLENRKPAQEIAHFGCFFINSED